MILLEICNEGLQIKNKIKYEVKKGKGKIYLG